MSDFLYNNNVSKLRENFLSNNDISEVHKFFMECVGNVPSNGNILDIGTGNGYIISEIRRIYPNQYYLFGVDISLAMLQKAEKLASNEVSFSLADNNKLPFPQGYFSAVTAKNVTNFSPTEIARVLTDDGLFIYREYGLGKGLVEIAKYFENRLIRSNSSDYYVDLLEKAGFYNIAVQKYLISRTYCLKDLLSIIQMFPFIKDLTKSDLDNVCDIYKDRKEIVITSDPFVLTARRKKWKHTIH